MAGIKNVIESVLAKIASQQFMNGDITLATPYVRVWNNQLEYERDGQLADFPKPAFFVEIVTPVTFEVIGQGFRSADLNIKIHIVHEYYNDGDGVTFEQDLLVFDLRDQLLVLLTYFNPTACGPLTCISEEMDSRHDNLYHYLMDFVCNFTDSKASQDDPARNYFIQSTPPTALEVQTTVDQGGDPIQRQFIINT